MHWTECCVDSHKDAQLVAVELCRVKEHPAMTVCKGRDVTAAIDLVDRTKLANKVWGRRSHAAVWILFVASGYTQEGVTALWRDFVARKVHCCSNQD